MGQISLPRLSNVPNPRGTPLGEVASRALLQSLIRETRRIIELWAGPAPSEEEADAPGILAISNTLELFGRSLVEVLQYVDTFHEPAVYAEQERRLQGWLTGEHSRAVAESGYIQSLAAFQGQELSVWPQIRWILANHSPHRSLGPVGEPNLSLELALIFITEDPTPDLRRRMDVFIGWGGERERFPMPRLVKSLLNPYARKRLYLPIGELSARDIRSAVEGMYALLLVYLVQEGLVNFDEDRTVQQFLLAYVGKFKKAKQVGVGSVLAHLLGTYVFPKRSRMFKRSKSIDPQAVQALRRYTLPEDYRAFPKYIKRTIEGLLKDEKKQDRSSLIADPIDPDGHLLIPTAANQVGISDRWLYDLVRKGKVRAEEVSIEHKRYLAIHPTEMARLAGLRQYTQNRKLLIECYSEKRGISIASARRWVERQEREGIGLQEMLEQIEHPSRSRRLRTKRYRNTTHGTSL